MRRLPLRFAVACTLAFTLAWLGVPDLGRMANDPLAPQAGEAQAASTQTVKLNANGGKASRKSIKVKKGGTFGALPSATRAWYQFAGWYSAKSGGVRVTSTTVVVGGIKVLYAHWTLTNVAVMKVGTKYSVALNGAKKSKVKIVDKRSEKNYTCTRTFYVGSKKVHSGNCYDGWYEYTLLRIDARTTLIYRVYYHEFERPGEVYRYAGGKLVQVKDLGDEDDGERIFSSVRATSAGSGTFTTRYSFAESSYFAERYYDWGITYRYLAGKLTVASAITTDPSSTGEATSAAKAFARYCPGAVPGNTTDVSIQAFTHPTWGKSTFLTCRAHISLDRPYNGEGAGVAAYVRVVDASNTVRWTAQDDDNHYSYGWALAKPATDRTGNLFVGYNPGRYDGIEVYRPVANGMTELQSFYYAELTSPDADGRYRIREYTNDCIPSCAGGTTTSRLYSWNGTRYV